jgi:hypothetical protein
MAQVGQALGGASAPLLQLAQVHGVVQAHHALAVLDGRELRAGGAAHGLGGAVGGDQVGVLGLDGTQVTDERVVVGVGDGGGVLLVVGAVVAPDLLAQPVHTPGGVRLGVGTGRGHGAGVGHGVTLPTCTDSHGRSGRVQRAGRGDT